MLQPRQHDQNLNVPTRPDSRQQLLVMFRSALDQLASAASSSQARQVLEISVDDVDPDPDQPRKTFEDLETLTASIAVIGIKQPLLVRAHPKERGRYRLIAGERRLRAARKVGLETVPCLVETGEAETPGQLVVTQLSENDLRQTIARPRFEPDAFKRNSELLVPFGQIAERPTRQAAVRHDAMAEIESRLAPPTGPP